MENQSGRDARVVLRVVKAVMELGDQKLALKQAQADELVEVEVKPAAQSGGKSIRRKRMVEESGVGRRGDLNVPQAGATKESVREGESNGDRGERTSGPNITVYAWPLEPAGRSLMV